MKAENRIRARRKELRLSGPEVASILGISTQYFYDIERGKRRLNDEILSKLSEVLKATTDYLLNRTDVNLYGYNQENSDSHEESELADIPIERLNQYKLTYKGRDLSPEEADDIIELLEAALKRWKK